MPIRLLLLLLLTTFPRLIQAQQSYPADYFRSPMDTTISLAGNFGEIRPNHFHAGFDIRTNNREGLPVYAAAEGFIYRIKISPFGYGKALYIKHPNGYSTVYGHLQAFNTAIDTYTKNIQYSKQSFEIDTFLIASALPVKKGDLIGYSGNTGGSQGPHLHFEIRESFSELPVNPYFFGYNIPDTVKPRVTMLAIYPLSDNATVNGKHLVKKIVPVYKKGKYSFLKQDTISVNGKIGFGIECYDTENGSTNKNGVYSIELQSGGKRIYYHQFEKFSFENSRYVNAHIDYREKQKNKNTIQKCFLSKNNQAGIYKDVLQGGAINFQDDSVHWIRYIVKDFYGNTTEMMLKVRSSSKARHIKAAEKKMLFMDCSVQNDFNKDDIKVGIPANTLYDDTYFTYLHSPGIKGGFSPIHKVLSTETAAQRAYTLSIKTSGLPINIPSTKLCIVSIGPKAEKEYHGGNFNDGWISTQLKSFGTFTVIADTLAPKIRPAFKLAKDSLFCDLSNAKQIAVYATDNLSGIRKYRATIDGQWVLCEYEAKQDLLFYTFDDRIGPGSHIFYIEVTDDRENRSTWMCTFKR
jgi:hypothetical protein